MGKSLSSVGKGNGTFVHPASDPFARLTGNREKQKIPAIEIPETVFQEGLRYADCVAVHRNGNPGKSPNHNGWFLEDT